MTLNHILFTLMKKNIIKSLLIVLIILVFAALITVIIFIFAAQNNNQTEWDKQNTRKLDSNDVVIRNAMQHTKDSLPSFIKYYNDRIINNGSFFVKIPLSENNNIEHMWLKIINLDATRSSGLLENEPAYLKNVRYGDTIHFDINDAEDLIIERNDTIYFGAFTDQELSKAKTTHS